MTCIVVAAPAFGAPGDIDAMTLSDVAEAAMRWRIPLLGALTLLTVGLLWATNMLSGFKERDVGPYPWLMWLFAALIVFVTMATSQQFVAQQDWLTGSRGGSMRALGAISAGVYVMTLAVAVGMAILFARSAPGAGLKAVLADIPLGLGCLILALPAVLLSSELLVLMHERLTGTQAAAVAHPMLRQITRLGDDPWAWALVGAAVVGAPIVEEIMYRGFLQSALLRWTHSAWGAILITSGVFTAMHALGEGAVDWYALAPIFILSLAMGVAYERTKHIGVPIVMHMGFNAMNIAIAIYAT